LVARKRFGAIAELGETHLNNAETGSFDVLFVASLELILRPAASL
jgi:hypothetical protein